MEYGTIIPNLTIHGKPAPYPVVNERGIRATAGIMLAVGATAFFAVRLTGSYTALYIVVPLFWLEFFLKTVLTPKFSLFGILGDFIVRNQEPEYVGAIQKRFAWSLGLAMASTMVIVSLAMGIRGWLPLSICGICLAFMWLESTCGICVGCNIYGWLRKKGLFHANVEHAPACPGGSCSIGKK